MRPFSRAIFSLAENMTSFGGPMMIANATSIYVAANATLYDGPFTDEKSLQQTLAYVWIVFLSALLGCIIVTTVLGKYYSKHIFSGREMYAIWRGVDLGP